MADEQLLSAEVVLRPAPGFDPSEPVTSANVAEAMPSPATVQRVQRYFERKGFEVGPSGPLSFSITAPARVFAKEFGTRSAGAPFDLSALPRHVTKAVDAIVTTPPPDFGPTNP
jgi:hypothetical protein